MKKLSLLCVLFVSVYSITYSAIVYPPDGSMLIYTDTPNHGLVISTNGRVGIGTLNPLEVLDVQGTVNATAFMGAISTNALVVEGNTAVLGYLIPLLSLSTSFGTSAGTYFGSIPQSTGAVGTRKIYIRKAGYIRAMEVYSYASTVGTTTVWTMNVLINNVASGISVTKPADAAERIWSATGLKVAVNVGDYIEIQSVVTRTVNPVTALSGYLYIE